MPASPVSKSNALEIGVTFIYIPRVPGIVIGRRGVEAEKLQADLERILQKDSNSSAERTVRINVTEIKRPELDAQLVAEAVALQIVRRSNFRQAMKKSIIASMKAGAQGVKNQYRWSAWRCRNGTLRIKH